jgi:hypothetical protein
LSLANHVQGFVGYFKSSFESFGQMSIEFGNPGSSFGWLLQYELPGFKKKVQRIHKLYAENWKRIVS